MEKTPKKILLVSHEMTYTGAPCSLLKVGKLLQEEGFSVDVWTLKDGEFTVEFQRMGMEVKKISFPADVSDSFSNTIALFDIVIANTIFCAAFARYAQRFTKTVLYIRESENIPQIIRDCGLEEKDFTEVKNLICVSEYARQFIEKRYGRTDVTVIPNFVEDDSAFIRQKRHLKKKYSKDKIFYFLVTLD